MKSGLLALAIIGCARAVPTTYAAPAGGWDSVDWSKVDYSGVDWNKVGYSNVDWNKVDYSKVDWNKVDYSKVDWNKVDYSKVDWSKVNYQPPKKDAQPVTVAPPKEDEPQVSTPCPAPPFFTTTWSIDSAPEQVVNGSGAATGGLPGSHAKFWLGLRSDADIICYEITLTGFQGDYQSPALTATHIHQGARGASGPPRIVFPDPTGDGNERRSVGCMKGPFKTGVVSNGVDSGEGFTVRQLEERPANFYVDIHSSRAVPGANRGQFL